MTSSRNRKSKRPYKLRARARRQEETRHRITEAAVKLHGTVGPARTTVAEVARLAGVQRMTVYNHFPTDAELTEACSSHWMARNPPPEYERWAAIGDAAARRETALREMYGWYGKTRQMMENVLRDAPLVPALSDIMERKWWRLLDAMVDVLAAQGEGGDDQPAPGPPRAALRLALDFSTWRTLTNSDLDDEEAARLAARLVAAVV